jgi:hypothetical protein
MNSLEYLGPWTTTSNAYQRLCEAKRGLVENCIDVAVNTDLGALIVGADDREPEEEGLVFTDGELTIASVGMGNIGYVYVNDGSQRVLTATLAYNAIELPDESLEYQDVVHLERFIPGDWEQQVERLCARYVLP